MRRLLFGIAVTASLAAPGSGVAQVYPTRPITMVAPFPAGAPVDMVGRIVAERMRASLGQPIIVENISGAAGSLGVGRAARAVGDGYTISLGNFSSHVLAGAFYTLQFDLLKDFAPVALLASNPQLVISRNTIPADDLTGLIAWLKANPDRASAGIAGVGSVSHVGGVFFQKETGTRFQFVPYRGVNLAQQDLIGGQIDLLFDQAVNALTNVRAGRIKAHAVMAKTRLGSAPDIPTVDEAGLPGFYMSVWNALWVPNGTPKAVIAALNTAAVDSMADPAVRDRLRDLGLEVPARDQQTPEALGSASQGRDREVVAYYQNGRHQGGVSWRPTSGSGPTLPSPAFARHGSNQGIRCRQEGDARRFKMTGADVDSHAIAIQSSESDQAGRRGTIAIGVNVYTGSPC